MSFPARDQNHISLDRLIHARALAAAVVKQHGEWALPIFSRLDREITKREAIGARLDAACAANTKPNISAD